MNTPPYPHECLSTNMHNISISAFPDFHIPGYAFLCHITILYQLRKKTTGFLVDSMCGISSAPDLCRHNI